MVIKAFTAVVLAGVFGFAAPAQAAVAPVETPATTIQIATVEGGSGSLAG